MYSRQSTASQLAASYLAATLLCVGCEGRDLRPLVPCTVSGVVNRVKVNAVDSIDLLLVIDDSGSMEEEQAALRAEIPRLVAVLGTGDVNGNGTFDEGIDFEPVSSLHVGVVTTDMGIGDGAGPNSTVCAGSGPFGDDGVIQLQSGPDVAACTVPSFLDFDPENDAEEDATQNIECVSNVGIDGCPLEQQLEAMLKAVTPDDSATRFIQRNGDAVIADTAGHAGAGANAGFFRRDALLAVVMVTDEDDCSTPDMRLFDVDTPPGATPYPVPVVGGQAAKQLQCATYRDAQYNVERYVDGLLAVRDDPSLVVYATISGVSDDLIARAEVSSDFYGTILDDPSMVEEPDPTGADLAPSCTRPNPLDVARPNEAYPPRRIVEVARRLEDRGGIGVVTSICNARDPDNGDFSADFGPALDRIIERIADALSGACLPRALTQDGTGEVNCDIVEILPVGVTCASRAAQGRVPFDPPRLDPGDDEIDGTADDREACRVTQVVPSFEDRTNGNPPVNATGWFYDDYTSDITTVCSADRQQRIGFTDDGQPLAGAIIRLECLEPVQPGGTRADIGSGCDDGCALDGDDLDSLQSQYDRETAQLACVEESNTCQLVCQSDADCPGGYTCFDADLGNTGAFAFCVNPTCAL